VINTYVDCPDDDVSLDLSAVKETGKRGPEDHANDRHTKRARKKGSS
jgi:hypothetical protein